MFRNQAVGEYYLKKDLKFALQKKIVKRLRKQDGYSTRIKTERGFLICDFSIKRYHKDKYEMEKQTKKAKILLQNPSKISKRNKFLKTTGKSKTEINKELIEKTKMLPGIKGYYTNLDNIDNKTVIKLYHNLWNVEKAFRMAKSDLKTRPIYHRKEKTIKAHILICFMALSVGEYIEIKSKLSLQKVLKIMKTAVDVKIEDEVTGQIINIPAYLSTQLKTL